MSFLPNSTLDSGEPRMIYTYSHAASGFAKDLTRGSGSHGSKGRISTCLPRTVVQTPNNPRSRVLRVEPVGWDVI